MKPTSLILALLPALAVAPARAATFVVSKTADTLDGACDADCSLREAVVAANAAPGADVIEIPAGVYVLSRPGAKEQLSRTGDLDIWDPVTLLGAGRTATILDGGEIDRVLHVLEPPAPAQAGYRVEVRDLTIRKGKTDEAGGGALNASRGVLAFTRATITNNLAAVGGGAATPQGVLELRDVRVLSNIGVLGAAAAWLVDRLAPRTNGATGRPHAETRASSACTTAPS
ncbi:MAG: CSLREA domain-containing protein [Candidatus Methylomirabilis sp.]|nr:CSLREA domain-containing protein [Deltaproteobacteria bacterium]